MKYFMLIKGDCSQRTFDAVGQAWDSFQRGEIVELPYIQLNGNSKIEFKPIPEDYSRYKYLPVFKGMTQRQLNIITKILDEWDNSKSLPCIQVEITGGIDFIKFPEKV